MPKLKSKRLLAWSAFYTDFEVRWRQVLGLRRQEPRQMRIALEKAFGRKRVGFGRPRKVLTKV